MEEKMITSVTKTNLNEAVALIYEEDMFMEKNVVQFGGVKSARECQLPCLRALNLLSTTNAVSTENSYRKVELLEELRTSLLENNYSAAAKILEYLIQSSTTLLLPAIWKAAVVLFLSNQDCTSDANLEEFLEMCTGQRSLEEKRRLIEVLVSLPDLLASRSRSGCKQCAVEVDQSNSAVGDDDDGSFLEI